MEEQADGDREIRVYCAQSLAPCEASHSIHCNTEFEGKEISREETKGRKQEAETV
jgi:hypothetical protein